MDFTEPVVISGSNAGLLCQSLKIGGACTFNRSHNIKNNETHRKDLENQMWHIEVNFYLYILTKCFVNQNRSPPIGSDFLL